MIVTVAGNELKVNAKYFVLAAGGIENPRILLLSNHQRPTGLGNHSGFVGRLFQEHIWYPSGLIFAARREPLRLYTEYIDYGPIKVDGNIAVASQKVRELRIPRFRAELIGAYQLATCAKPFQARRHTDRRYFHAPMAARPGWSQTPVRRAVRY